jgi:hypothetical protein
MTAPTAFPSSAPSDIFVTIEVQLDGYPQETRWELWWDGASPTKIAQRQYLAGTDYGMLRTDTVSLTQPTYWGPGSYAFKMFDSANDGICCQYTANNKYGYVKVHWWVPGGGEVPVLHLFNATANFGSSASRSFVVASPTTAAPTPAPTLPPTPVPTPLPTPAPTPAPTPVPTPIQETPAPVTATPTTGSTVGPSAAATTDIFLKVEVQLDGYPQEVSYKLYKDGEVNPIKTTAFKAGDDYGMLRYETIQLPSWGLYTFTILDSAKDGICCGYLVNEKISYVKVNWWVPGGEETSVLYLHGSQGANFGSSYTNDFEVTPLISTSLPTAAPITQSPTLRPTEAPITQLPTAFPTLPPTSPPTAAPITQSPTAFPTLPPTPLPTAPPTSLPTTFPTPLPTAPPTLLPTAFPTLPPTAPPTSLPTTFPTPLPTPLPTAFPTLPPTAPPTPLPTPLPTAPPTPLPTAPPTPVPTAFPTLPPTTPPTPLPTAPPTAFPTLPPTPPPTPLPTAAPAPSSSFPSGAVCSSNQQCASRKCKGNNRCQ